MDGQILDAEEGIRLREQAIARVEANAEEDKKAFLLEAVRRVALKQATVFCDDVWSLIPDEMYPHEPRVFGAIMRAANKAGWVDPTDEFRLSARPSVHRNPKRVWKSLLFEAE